LYDVDIFENSLLLGEGGKMKIPMDNDAIHLFLRLLLGLLFLSTAINKILHREQLRKDIEDYKIIPLTINSLFAISTLLAFGLPLSELVAGIGLVSGFLLVPALLLTLTLLLVFSGAIVFNLLQGRRELSCHCGGVLGEHRISWWLVGRNILLIGCSFIVLFTPPDPFTIDAIMRRSSSLDIVLWTSTALPVVLLVFCTFAVLLLLDAVRVVLRSSLPCPPYGSLYKTTCTVDNTCTAPTNLVFTKYVYAGGCVRTGSQCPIDRYCSSNCQNSCPSGC